MWVMTKNVFVSIEQDDENPTVLLVRGRIKGDVSQFLDLAEAAEEVTPGAEYRFCIRADRRWVENRLAAEAGAVDYPDYKSAIDIRDVRRRHVAKQIWEIWSREQGTRYGTRRRADESASPSTGTERSSRLTIPHGTYRRPRPA